MIRWVVTALGVLFCLVGAVWLLQGVGVLPGSFMAGQLFWARAGAVVLVVGIALIALSQRRRSSSGR